MELSDQLYMLVTLPPSPWCALGSDLGQTRTSGKHHCVHPPTNHKTQKLNLGSLIDQPTA